MGLFVLVEKDANTTVLHFILSSRKFNSDDFSIQHLFSVALIEAELAEIYFSSNLYLKYFSN